MKYEHHKSPLSAADNRDVAIWLIAIAFLVAGLVGAIGRKTIERNLERIATEPLVEFEGMIELHRRVGKGGRGLYLYEHPLGSTIVGCRYLPDGACAKEYGAPATEVMITGSRLEVGYDRKITIVEINIGGMPWLTKEMYVRFAREEKEFYSKLNIAVIPGLAIAALMIFLQQTQRKDAKKVSISRG